MKFKKSKLLVVAGTCLLGIAALASCQKDNTPTINVWANSDETSLIESAVAEYNKTAKEKIKIKVTAVTEAEAGTTLAKDPNVSGSPALFLCADDHVPGLAQKNIILEIKGKYADAIKESVTEKALVAASYEGKVYGYPATNDNGFFLWYNKEELKDSEAGSLEKILEVAKAKGKKLLYDLENGWYACSIFVGPDVCGQNSIQWKTVKSGDETKIKYDITWDNEKGVAACEYLSNLLAPYYKDGTIVQGGNDVLKAGFDDESIIAGVSGTWMEKDLKAAIGDKLGATKMPTFDGKQLGSFTGAKIYCVNKTRPADEQKVAVKLAQLLTDKKTSLDRYEKRKAIPANKEAVADERFTKGDSIGCVALNEQNKYAALQSTSAEGRYWDIGKTIAGAVIKGELGEYKTWAEFLKAQCDILRKEQ